MYVLPDLKELLQRTRVAFRTHLAGSDAWLWPNNIFVSAKVIAGKTFELFGFAAYIQKQIFVHTSPDIESLTLHGNEFGITRKPAAPAEGDIIFTSTEDLIVADAAVLRRTDGVEYRVVSGGTRSGAGTLTVSAICTTDGITGNLEAGASLEIISGVTGDATAVVATGGFVLGVDVEDMESFRQRILFRKRNPPHGGAPADYVMWAGQVAGVSFREDGEPTVFVERLWDGPGSVRVFPLMYDLYSDGIPLAADVERVEDYLATVQPAGAAVTVAAPVAVPVAIVINGMEPDTPAVREQVELELRDAFKRLSRVAGSDANFGSMPYLAYPTTFSTSWIWQAVANASGEERHTISAPAADIALTAGQIATFGTLTFNP
jgi:uncharacterized phage protein gp47/JayE